MKTCFAIRPQIANAGHHQRKQRRQQLLEVIADEKVFLSWFAHDCCGVNSVATMKDRVDMKYRIVVLQRIIAVVITEWTFRTPFVWPRRSYQGELGFSRKTVWRAAHLRNPDLLTSKQRSQYKFRNIFRQRGNRSEHQRG